MERTELVDRIRNIVISVVKHDNFEMQNGLTATDVDGWDSLSHMMIISEIEKVFNIKFKLKELNKINDMGDLIALVSDKTNTK